MTNPQDEFKFFYNGVFYKTEEEFSQAVGQWEESPASEQSCRDILDKLNYAVWMNVQVHKIKIPNALLSHMLNEAVYRAIGEIVNKLEPNETEHKKKS